MIRRKFTTALLFILLSSILLACTDYKEIQSTAMQAITKQGEMTSYSFEGNAKLQLDDGLVQSTNPLTLTFINMLKESTIEWKGTAQSAPARLEITLKLTPKGTTTPIEIPVLIKDNKLYFYMPAINKPDEYFVIDLAKALNGSDVAVNPEGLEHATASLSNMLGIFMSNAEPKWFSSDKAPTPLSDGTTGRSINMEITAANEQAVNLSLQAKLGELIESLNSSGIITTETSDKWKKADSKSFTVKAPSKLHFVIDNDGNIRDQTIDLQLAITDSKGVTKTHTISINQSFSNINIQPAFELEIPSKLKSFDEILKFIAPANTNK